MRNKNIIISLVMISLMVTMISALPSKTVYKYEPVLLQEGQNGIGIIPNYSTLSLGDYNVSLVNRSAGSSNLIGMSFLNPNGRCVNLNDLIFYNYNGDSYNYQDAKTNNWIDAIEFTDELDASGSMEKYNKLCSYEAFWIKSYLAVNMTIPNVYGSPVGETFDWIDLRFSNGTDELGIVEAGGAGWVTTTLQYWGPDAFGDYQFRYIDAAGLSGKSTLSPLEGFFIRSYSDNIYLLTNNETKTNTVKVKCNGKISNGVCKMKVKAKYVGSNKVGRFRGFNNHIVRLIGMLRGSKG